MIDSDRWKMIAYKDDEQHFHVLVGFAGELISNVPHTNPYKALNQLYDIVNEIDPYFITVEEQAEISENIIDFIEYDFHDRHELARVNVHLGDMGFVLEECFGCPQVHYN